MATGPKIERIPMPEKMPIVGNALTVNSAAPLQSLMELSRELGPIMRMDMIGTPIVFVSGHDLVEELCDEKRFDKTVRGSLRRVRAVAGDGLFTGDTAEPNWSKAHRILLPTFSRQAMGGYFPMMLDVASQLCLKWERMNADDEIDVVHDMTAVALDVIGICGFNYRFNSFYRQDYHPFIDALNNTLETCMMQRGLPFEQQLMRRRMDQMKKDVGFMNKLVDNIIAERRRSGDRDTNDLLNYMLDGVDKVTGESLSDENIRFQIITFLIAGHETTSGLMSFTLYFLMNNPDVLAKCYEEVDRVLGRDIAAAPSLKQVGQMGYMLQVVQEALRLYPTAPAFSVTPYEDEVIGGKYKIKKGTFTTVLTLMLHRDQSVWGPNAENFDPEHFSPEAVAARPVNAYKPFGNGQRACLGRQFALQEAVLTLAMILQRFELIDHKSYEMNIKESLSIKPEGLSMKVRMRRDVVRGSLVSAGVAAPDETQTSAAAAQPSHGTRATVLYGSNLGSTEEFARALARDAELNGFDVTLSPLDDAAGQLPTDGAVLIACASYNGTPPDNARVFVDWLENAAPNSLAGVQYSVFGCGHSDWAATFQATPRFIDRRLSELGATRLIETAEGDARHDIDETFETWAKGVWPQLAAHFGIEMAEVAEAVPMFEIEELAEAELMPVIDSDGAQPVPILANRELQNTAVSGRSTRHIEVALPSGMAYRTGDHLSVLPSNSPALVDRVMERFGFRADAQIRIKSHAGSHAKLPVGQPVRVRKLLSQMLELQSLASRRDVATLARHTACPVSRPKLDALSGDGYKAEVQIKRMSVLQLLEMFPACELPFGVYLELCPMLAPRYYSISSSPRATPNRASITVGVVDEPGLASEDRYRGVCSNFLKDSADGHTIYAALRSTTDAFRLPEDPSTPVLMIGPGTGLAPFRGFLQERSVLKQEGADLGSAMLFFGCRHPDQDYLYQDELTAFADEGVTDLRVAFSRHESRKVYVQDLLREERAAVWEMIEAGAHIYVCGDGARMEPDVRRALTLIYSEEKDVSLAAAEAWLNDMAAAGRYALDVWVSD